MRPDGLRQRGLIVHAQVACEEDDGGAHRVRRVLTCSAAATASPLRTTTPHSAAAPVAPTPPTTTVRVRARRRRPSSTRLDPIPGDRTDRDDVRLERARRGLERLERRVGAEVRDAPAARAQREPERDQPELVLLPGEARQERARPDAAAPIAAQAEQAPAEHVRREVLLRDRRLAALPALPELVKVGEKDVPQEARRSS